MKLLNEELAALREAGAQAAESLQSAQATSSELEDRLQRAAWELRDLAAMKDARCGSLLHPLGGRGRPAAWWGPCLEGVPVLLVAGGLPSNAWVFAG